MASGAPGPAFWFGKRVAVTGGAGFLGKPMMARLRELGADVRVVRSAEHDLRETEATKGALLAKKMNFVLSDANRRQYGLGSCVPVMSNLYRPRDNFDLEDSRVIAAMVHKYALAAERNNPEVVLWVRKAAD